MRNIYATLNAENYASATAVSRSWRNIGRGLAANNQNVRRRLNWANPSFRQADDFKKVMRQGLEFVRGDASREMLMTFSPPISLPQANAAGMVHQLTFKGTANAADMKIKVNPLGSRREGLVILQIPHRKMSGKTFDSIKDVNDIVTTVGEHYPVTVKSIILSEIDDEYELGYETQQVYPVLDENVEKSLSYYRNTFYDPNRLSRSGRISQLNYDYRRSNHMLPYRNRKGSMGNMLVDRLQRN